MIMLRFKRKRKIRDFFNLNKSINSIANKNIIYCDEKNRLSDVIELMFLSGYRRIPIVSKNNLLKGLATSVDILDIFLKKRISLYTPISKVMKRDIYVLENKHNLKRVVELFKTYRRGGYPVIKEKKVISIVTDFDFLKNIDKPTGISIEEMMVYKPIFAKENYNIRDVANMMVKGGFRRLPIVRDGILVGIVTPYDVLKYLKNKRFRGFKKDETKIKEIMSKNPLFVEPEQDVFDVVKIMKENRIGGVPVTEEHELVGIITERDILEAI